MKPNETRNQIDTAVVLIHGIGDITPGNVLEYAKGSIRKRLGVEISSSSEEYGDGSSTRTASQVRYTNAQFAWRDRLIEIVEFNWTGLIGKIRLRHPLDAIKKLLEVVSEFPLLGASSGSVRLQKFARSAGIFQRWLLLALIAAVTGSVVEIAVRSELSDLVWTLTQESLAAGDDGVEIESLLGPTAPLVGDNDTPLLTLFFASIGVLAFSRAIWEGTYFFNLAAWFLYFVAGFYYGLVVAGYIYFLPVRLLLGRRLSRLGMLWRTLSASSIIVFIVGLFFMEIPALALFAITSIHHSGEAWLPSLWDLTFWYIAGIAVLTPWLFLKLAVVIGNLLRDVIHYLAPDPVGSLQPHQERIRTELARLLQSLDERRCKRVILVAHSLGTVIVTDLLRDRASMKTINHGFILDLVTAGSPLRRLIHRLLPDRDLPTELRQELLRTKALGLERWFNVYRLFDYVGQAMTYSALPKDLVFWRRPRKDAKLEIAEYLLKPRYQWPLAHANYWGDDRFLEFLAEHVLQPVLTSEKTTSAE